MAPIDLTSVEPFEICSIRPPTENCSLTFRLTRNCGWNRCLFCPVYKYGAQFSRRSIEEVKRDVDRAKVINDLLIEYGIGTGYSAHTSYQEAAILIEKIRTANMEEKESDQTITVPDHNRPLQSDPPSPSPMDVENEEDERLVWFASWFKDKPTIEDSVYHILNWQLGGGQACFLGDSNSLLLSPDFFAEAIKYIKDTFPTLNRFTIYGRTKSAAKKDLKDLRAFKEAGLHRIHFGLESGNDTVLQFMKKGVTATEHIQGCLKVKEAGLSCCVYVMPGLGGAKWSEEHAIDTAKVLTAIAPDYIRLRSLEIFPKTGLSAAVQRGDFIEAPEEQVIKEIRIIVERIEAECEIVSDSASNLLDVNGTLPLDRRKMLEVIDDYLSLTPKEKLAFSLASRLRSFIGQYGGLTQDILHAVAPYVTGHKVDISGAPNHEVANKIKLIRSKLMP
ncbi:MAG: radical SAM protein [Deltaproteobacteria bacterium]|nr:radical SAM protein [Deltaproteobacteria bacterium]